MKIIDAQREVRTVYMGAFSGLIVTSIIWFLSADAGTWRSTGLAILILIVGEWVGAAIYLLFAFPFKAIALRT